MPSFRSRFVALELSLLLLLGYSTITDAVSAAPAVSWPPGTRMWESPFAPVGVLHLEGEITPHLADALNLWEKTTGKKVNQIVVDGSGSPGGDVYASIRIGRLLRRNEGMAYLSAPCASACVFVFAGAVQRATGTDAAYLGIHRPFSSVSSGSFAAEQAQFNTTRADLEQYLQEMNVGSDLLKAMIDIPPEAVRWINREEAASLGLVEYDPVWLDYMAGKGATELGISRLEFNDRLGRRHRECDQFSIDSPEFCTCLKRIGLYSYSSKSFHVCDVVTDRQKQ